MLYHSLFNSRLNYCQLVWGTTTATNVDKIYMLQKKCIRHIFNAHFVASTRPLFSSSGIIKVHQLYNYALSRKFRSETIRHIKNLRSLANLRARNLNYPTRHGEKWEVDKTRLNSGKQRLSHTLPALLNYCDLKGFDLFNCSYHDIHELFAI